MISRHLVSLSALALLVGGCGVDSSATEGTGASAGVGGTSGGTSGVSGSTAGALNGTAGSGGATNQAGTGGSAGALSNGGSTDSAGAAGLGSGGQDASNAGAAAGGSDAMAGTGGDAADDDAADDDATDDDATDDDATDDDATDDDATDDDATDDDATDDDATDDDASGDPDALLNAPIKSAGCGQPLGALTAGGHTIMSSGNNRDYTIDIPADYDPDNPYRLFFTWHWIGASDDVLVDGLVEFNEGTGGPDVYAYYGLKRQAEEAGEPAIFIAPSSMGSTWQEYDHALFDDLLALAKESLCIDTTRVFATGFSFGAMMTYSLSTNHQQDLRAVVAMAPANYNIYLPTNTHEPIAYMSTTGMGDTTCPWDGGQNRGAKYAAMDHATDNGCTVPADIPTTNAGSQTHVCYDFEGCPEQYPVKACTFDGGHIPAVADGGTQNNGQTSWIPVESWKFFSQF